MDRRPMIVLVSGHPGAGKTTLARRLGDLFGVPHVNRDHIRGGLWRTSPDRPVVSDTPWELFWHVLETYLANGVSVVADQTFYRGISDHEIRDRLLHLASAVNVHCRTPNAFDRWLTKIRNDPRVTSEALDSLIRRCHADGAMFSEPLELGIPVIDVDTTDGYDPDLEHVACRLLELTGLNIDPRGNSPFEDRQPSPECSPTTVPGTRL